MPPALLLLICKLTGRCNFGSSLSSRNNPAKDTALTLQTDIFLVVTGH